MQLVSGFREPGQLQTRSCCSRMALPRQVEALQDMQRFIELFHDDCMSDLPCAALCCAMSTLRRADLCAACDIAIAGTSCPHHQQLYINITPK